MQKILLKFRIFRRFCAFRVEKGVSGTTKDIIPINIIFTHTQRPLSKQK